MKRTFKTILLILLMSFISSCSSDDRGIAYESVNNKEEIMYQTNSAEGYEILEDEDYVQLKENNANLLENIEDLSVLHYLDEKEFFDDDDLAVIAQAYGFENIEEYNSFISRQNYLVSSLRTKYDVNLGSDLEEVIIEDLNNSYVEIFDPIYETDSSCKTKLKNCKNNAKAEYYIAVTAAALAGVELAIPTGGWGALVGVGGWALASYKLYTSYMVCQDNYEDCKDGK